MPLEFQSPIGTNKPGFSYSKVA